jgi:hypothetical protein
MGLAPGIASWPAKIAIRSDKAYQSCFTNFLVRDLKARSSNPDTYTSVRSLLSLSWEISLLTYSSTVLHLLRRLDTPLAKDGNVWNPTIPRYDHELF